jgi:hypothetical protein
MSFRQRKHIPKGNVYRKKRYNDFSNTAVADPLVAEMMAGEGEERAFSVMEEPVENEEQQLAAPAPAEEKATLASPPPEQLTPAADTSAVPELEKEEMELELPAQEKERLIKEIASFRENSLAVASFVNKRKLPDAAAAGAAVTNKKAKSTSMNLTFN